MSTTAEEVTAITKAFTDATTAFTPIIGPPRDDDIQKIRKTILRILIDIEYDGVGPQVIGGTSIRVGGTRWD